MHDRKIKVLRIVTRLNIGGVSFHTVLLTAHLDSDNFQSIMAKGKEGALEGSMKEMIEAKGITPILIPELKKDISLIEDFKAFRKILALIKKEKPDIVHTHLAKAGALGRMAAKLSGVPIIIHTFHGHVFDGYFGYLKTKMIVLIERLLAHFTTKIITISDKVRKDVIERHRISNNSKATTIPLGLELSPFLEANKYRGHLRKELGLLDNTPLIGIVARLVPIKGHQYFLEAAAQVTKVYPTAKFLIIGDGELRRQLEDHVKRSGMQENTIFSGFRKDLTKIYADLDIVVLSSLNEGLPVTVIEALAAAKPVVATDVGGTGDLIEDKITGLLVPPRNSKALAEGILYLLSNPEEGIRMGKNGQRKVYPALNYTRLVEDIEKLYIELLNKKKNKPSL